MKHTLMMGALVTLMTGLSTAPLYAGTIQIGVNGLVCAFCVQSIEKGFQKVEAVEKVKVSLDDKLITLTTKEGAQMDDKLIEETVNAAGYSVTDINREE